MELNQQKTGGDKKRDSVIIWKQQVGVMRPDYMIEGKREEPEGGAERKTDLKGWCKGGVPHGFRNMEG